MKYNQNLILVHYFYNDLDLVVKLCKLVLKLSNVTLYYSRLYFWSLKKTKNRISSQPIVKQQHTFATIFQHANFKLEK